MNILFQYAVKVVLGRSSGDVVAPGEYWTAVNVHNPWYKTVYFRKKVAIALPGEQPGRVSPFFEAKLGPDEAFEIDRIVDMPTLPLAAGASVDLKFPIPPGCFDPDCEFRIIVDVGGAVVESNEGNNFASGTCLG